MRMIQHAKAKMLDLEWIERNLSDILTITKDIRRFHEDIAKAQKQYEATKQQLQSQLKACQKDCPHFLTTYYPDASGNNDSWTECDICGAEVRRTEIGGYDG